MADDEHEAGHVLYRGLQAAQAEDERVLPCLTKPGEQAATSETRAKATA